MSKLPKTARLELRDKIGYQPPFWSVLSPAGVDLLCELANQNLAFAQMSIEFLLDMFHDEIESVRLNSINCLIKLHEHIDLREEQ